MGPRDWYARRQELHEGMIFRSCFGFVKLDRQVPGDATQWYVQSWHNGNWFRDDGTIEPCDLQGEPLRSVPIEQAA